MLWINIAPEQRLFWDAFVLVITFSDLYLNIMLTLTHWFLPCTWMKANWSNEWWCKWCNYKVDLMLSNLFAFRWFLRNSGCPKENIMVCISTIIFGFLFLTSRVFSIIPFWLSFHGNLQTVTVPYQLDLKQKVSTTLFTLCILLDTLNILWSIKIIPICWKAVKTMQSQFSSVRSGRLQNWKETVDEQFFCRNFLIWVWVQTHISSGMHSTGVVKSNVNSLV